MLRRILLLTTFLSLLTGSVQAGEVSFLCTGWSNLAGSALSQTSAYSTTVEDGSGMIKLDSLNSGHNHNLSGDVTFQFYWIPAYGGETPPASIDVTIQRSFSLTADGNGNAALKNGSTVIEEVNSTDNFTSGLIGLLSTDTHTVYLSSHPDGTASGSLVISSYLLDVSFNSTTSVISSATESFSVFDVEI